MVLLCCLYHRIFVVFTAALQEVAQDHWLLSAAMEYGECTV
jgi:hypothetical protein